MSTPLSREVVIVSIARTPQGAFQGSLASLSAPKLGAIAIKAALERAGIDGAKVDEVYLGNVLQAGIGQAPARQAAIFAGIPNAVPATTINKVCGSGMKAIMLGVQSILTGDNEVVVAGGMESMSNVPYYLPNARTGLRMGNAPFIDGMIHDGLWDPYNNQHMGTCGELCAKEKGFTREMQDGYAIESFKRANAAWKDGKFKDEVTPVELVGKKGDKVLVEIDEGPSKVNYEKIPGLKPVFDKLGSVTAANASSINDGAAAVVLMSADKAKALGVKPLARIVSYAGVAQDPVWFTTAPAEGMRRAMEKAGWKLGDVDLFEVSEAFAVVPLAVAKDLGVSMDKMNIYGGGISVGHPLGATGARLVTTLVNALKNTGKKKGVAGVCIGGGEATAICLEIL
ncbi:MAG: acetyl-CoA C-acyltransferase [Cryobacterium sp.]|nr:acetyl-CoA C-acyltransferase [Oligoflexia bacterium]